MTISNNEALALIESYAAESATGEVPIGINGLTTIEELGVTLGDDFDAMVAEESGCDCAFDQATRDGWTCVADVLGSMSEIGVVEADPDLVEDDDGDDTDDGDTDDGEEDDGDTDDGDTDDGDTDDGEEDDGDDDDEDYNPDEFDSTFDSTPDQHE